MVTIKDVKLSLMHYGSNLSLSSACSLCPLLSSVASSSSSALLRESLQPSAAFSHTLLSSTFQFATCASCLKPTFNLEAYTAPEHAQIHTHVIHM